MTSDNIRKMSLNRDVPRGPVPDNLTDYLFGLTTAERRKAVDDFRIEYERVHGLTDLTRRYTSQLPQDEIDWLASKYPHHFFQGLPPFVQEYVRVTTSKAQESGALDDLAPLYLHLLVSGAITPRQSGRGR